MKAGREATAYTVSEGQGYGMIIVALMAGHDSGARTLFDGLWEFSLDHRSEIDSRLMDWKVEADEQPDADGNDSAFDGDCSLALALLLAEKQWGNAGRFDYGAQAAWVMGGILASTGFLEGPNDGFYYYYSSLRVPLWLGIDAVFVGDAVSGSQLRKIFAWAWRDTAGRDFLGLPRGRG